jgi:hypothetical protein
MLFVQGFSKVWKLFQGFLEDKKVEKSWCRNTALDLYSRDSRFESQLWHRLSWQMFFVDFLSPSRKIPGYYLNYIMTATFLILSYSSLFSSPTIRRSRDSILKTPINNPRNKHMFLLSLLPWARWVLRHDRLKWEGEHFSIAHFLGLIDRYFLF